MKIKEIKNKKVLFHKKKNEFKFNFMKSIINDLDIDLKYRVYLSYVFTKKKHFLSKNKTRCFLTNRSRSINSYYQLSRIEMRKKISNGEICGLLKKEK